MTLFLSHMKKLLQHYTIIFFLSNLASVYHEARDLWGAANPLIASQSSDTLKMTSEMGFLLFTSLCRPVTHTHTHSHIAVCSYLAGEIKVECSILAVAAVVDNWAQMVLHRMADNARGKSNQCVPIQRQNDRDNSNWFLKEKGWGLEGAGAGDRCGNTAEGNRQASRLPHGAANKLIYILVYWCPKGMWCFIMSFS